MRIMPFMKRKKGVQFAGAGASDYDDLSNKPQIGGVTLTGNKTLADLGVQSVLTFDNTPTENSSNPVKSGGVWNELNSKFVTKEFGCPEITLPSGNTISSAINVSVDGYTPVCCTIKAASHASQYTVSPVLHGSNVYLQFARNISSSYIVDPGDVYVLVLYMKS